MNIAVTLFSEKEKEINNFLSKFYNTSLDIPNSLKWEKKYQNPVEITEIIGTFVDNEDDFNISMWVCLDKDVFIKVTSKNADDIIKYIYERFPY